MNMQFVINLTIVFNRHPMKNELSTMDQIKADPKHFNTNGFLKFRVTEECMKFWTKENIDQLSNLCTTSIFNHRINEDIIIFPTLIEGNDNKRKQFYFFNDKSCSKNFRCSTKPIDRRLFYENDILIKETDKKFAQAVIDIENEVCSFLNVPLDYFIQTSALFAEAGKFHH